MPRRGAGDVVLSSHKQDGSTPSRLAEVPQRGVVAAQSANIGSRFLEMCGMPFLTRCGGMPGLAVAGTHGRRLDVEMACYWPSNRAG